MYCEAFGVGRREAAPDSFRVRTCHRVLTFATAKLCRWYPQLAAGVSGSHQTSSIAYCCVFPSHQPGTSPSRWLQPSLPAWQASAGVVICICSQLAHPCLCLAGAVLDGRDIGTVICPDAPVKLYVTADVVVRAQRRLDELKSRGNASAADVNFDAVLSDMKARDDRDMNRATAPLKPADDAVILDTTQMSIEQAFAQARSIVETALAQQQQELQQQQPVAA